MSTVQDLSTRTMEELCQSYSHVAFRPFQKGAFVVTNDKITDIVDAYNKVTTVDYLPLSGVMTHCGTDLPRSNHRPTCATTKPPIPQLTTPTYVYLL
jgi:hypothetical protein